MMKGDSIDRTEQLLQIMDSMAQLYVLVHQQPWDDKDSNLAKNLIAHIGQVIKPTIQVFDGTPMTAQLYYDDFVGQLGPALMEGRIRRFQDLAEFFK